ncbi:MAG: tetratricopeptide repeat protein [Myxococcota bacterium]|nr:tetratricopeptide repeat protein [Myxococcota bacterium]
MFVFSPTRPLAQARPQRARLWRAALAGVLFAGLMAAGCGPSQDAQLAEIRALQEAGQYEASIAPIRKLLAERSDNPEANLRLGVALRQTGRPSLAIFPLQKAALSAEYEIQAGLLLAAVQSASNSFQEAIRSYNRVLAADPGNAAALFGRGRAELSIGQPDRALQSAEALLAARPDYALAITLKGSALLDLGRSEEAEADLRRVLDRAMAANDPADAARKCAALGLFYRGQNAPESASETFSRCVVVYPRHAQLRQHASDFFLSEGDSEKAIGIWRSAIDTTPEDLGLRIQLAQILDRLERNEEALAVLQESVDLFDSPEVWQMLAGFYRHQGKLEAAREALEASMERSRVVTASLRFTLADILIEEGNIERAAEIAESLEEPSYRAMIRGTILLAQGKPAEALQKLDAGLRLYPNNAGARYLAGQAALAIGDNKRAQAEFREALRVSDSETDASERLAELYFRQGEYLTARQFANRQIKNRPYGTPAAYIISARSSVLLEEPEKAEGVLESLRTAAPGDPTAYLEFASLRRRGEGPQAAIDILMEGEFDLTQPQNESVLRALALDRIAIGDGAKALQLAEAASLENPEHPGFHDLKGQILAELGRPEAAKKAADAALALDSSYAPSLATRGNLALRSGDLSGASEFFDRASSADPSNPHYVYLAGQTRFLQSDVAGAQKLYRKALDIDPVHLGANNDLAWTLASEGQDLEAALEYAQRAARADRNADTLDTLGFVHLSRGEALEAINLLNLALELRPESASIRYRLGVALAASGDDEAARAMLREALGSSSFPEAEAARVELARLENS